MSLTISTLLAVALLTTTIAFIISLYLRQFRLYRETAKFPGPPTLPFIGNAHIFVGISTENILNKLQGCLDTYSSPFRISLMHKLFYIVYDPEQLKTILMSTKMVEKNEVYALMKPWVGDGLLTASTSIWKIHRKLISPTFNSQILESFVEIFSTKSQIMVKQMDVQLNGEEFDISHYVSLCTLDMICETTMGVPSKTQTQRNSPYVESSNRLMEIMCIRIFNIWLYPDIIFNNTELGKKQRECIKYLHGLTDDVIKRKKREFKDNGTIEKTSGKLPEIGKKRKAFLDLLIEMSSDESKFTEKELREEVDTMIITGSDTTATATSFVFLMLAYHPEIQDKVFDEICEIYGAEDLSSVLIKLEDLNRMQYLERVIKETMRLFPIGPILVRSLTDDINIGKYTLMKGNSVGLAIMKVHRSEAYWTDPLTFNPDRFLPEECAKRHPYTYIPFSAGPRNCIGQKYAMMAMKVLISTVICNYVIKKDNILPIKDIKLKADIVLKPQQPITIKIKRRVQEKSDELIQNKHNDILKNSV